MVTEPTVLTFCMVRTTFSRFDSQLKGSRIESYMYTVIVSKISEQTTVRATFSLSLIPSPFRLRGKEKRPDIECFTHA